MKKYIKITLFLLIAIFIIAPNKSYAKNKFNVTINNEKITYDIHAYNNKNIKIKTNCKNFKYEILDYDSGDLVSKSKVKGNSFNLKFKLKKNQEYKQYNIYLMKKGFSTEYMRLYIFRFKTENQYKNNIKGLSKKYNNFLKYPYLKIKDKSFLKNKKFIQSLQLQWDILPSYVKDSMVKTKHKIYIYNKKYKNSYISCHGWDTSNVFWQTLNLKNENNYDNLLVDFGFYCYSEALYYYCYNTYYNVKSNFNKKDYDKIGWPYYSDKVWANSESDYYVPVAFKVNYAKNIKAVDNKRIFECLWNCTNMTKINGYYCFYYNDLSQHYKDNYYINGQNVNDFNKELKIYFIFRIKEEYKDIPEDKIWFE